MDDDKVKRSMNARHISSNWTMAQHGLLVTAGGPVQSSVIMHDANRATF